jgi:hypothetical protein
MLIFFGIRSTVIKQQKIERETTCPKCQATNSFVSCTNARYFHIFWIPIFPLGKSTVIVCSNCGETYRKRDFTETIVQDLERENQLNPPRRPIWHSCGCLLIIGFILLSFIVSLFTDLDSDAADDVRRDYLNSDLGKTTTNITAESDSISFKLKSCVSLIIEGINTENIGYYSRVNDDKILVLLKVKDMKKIEPSSRSNLVYAVEECLDVLLEGEYYYYIGVDGNWNLLMTKSPNASDLGGKYGDREILLPFYDNLVDDTYLDY